MPHCNEISSCVNSLGKDEKHFAYIHWDFFKNLKYEMIFEKTFDIHSISINKLMLELVGNEKRRIII